MGNPGDSGCNFDNTGWLLLIFDVDHTGSPLDFDDDAALDQLQPHNLEYRSDDFNCSSGWVRGYSESHRLRYRI